MKKKSFESPYELRYWPTPRKLIRLEIPATVDWTEVVETMRKHFHPNVPLEPKTWIYSYPPHKP